MQRLGWQSQGLFFIYRVVISSSAGADLFDILRYIAYELGNPQGAIDFADGVEKCYTDLADMPSAYSFCDDPLLRLKGYRKYSVGNYLVIYRVVDTESIVRVVHIFHVSQNYLKIQRGEI